MESVGAWGDEEGLADRYAEETWIEERGGVWLVYALGRGRRRREREEGDRGEGRRVRVKDVHIQQSGV